MFVGIFLSKIATYLYKVVVARTFGQEIYGLFSLATMISILFASVLSLGLQSGLLRYISFYRGSNEPEKIKSIFKFSLVITLFVSVAGAVALFLLSDFISVTFFHTSELALLIKWFAVFIPIFVFSGLFHVITIAYEKVGWYSFIGNILSPTMQLIFLVIFIFLGLKTEALALSYNLGFFVILVSSFLVCKYGIKTIFGKTILEKKERTNLSKKLLSYSWPIMFLGFLSYLFSWIDSFTIGYFENASEVGLYNAAVPISFFLLIVQGLFLQLFLPIITKEYSKKNFKLIKNLSKQVGKWIFVFNLPLLIIMVFFPGAVINLLFGSEYIQAENALRFLSIGMFFHSIFLISENLLSMVGKSKIILFNLLIASVVNVTLNIVLIPKYGINGAAFSTMLSYILWGFLSMFIAKHYTSIVPLKTNMSKVILVAIIPTAILFYVRSIIAINLLSLLLLGIAFVIVYFALIIVTHCLDKNDLMILKAIKKKIFPKRMKALT